jgi:hypothetical protein
MAYDGNSDVLTVCDKREAEARAFKRRSILWGVAGLLVLSAATALSGPIESLAGNLVLKLMGALVLAALVVCAVLCETSLLWSWRAGDRAAAIRSSLDNHAETYGLLRSGRPFALYLRDYRADRHKTVLRSMPAGASFRDTTPHFEESLVSSIGSRLPIVGLLNIDEEYADPRIRRVFASDQHWLEQVVAYAQQATLIIMCVDGMTDRLWRELEVLESAGAAERLFLSITKGVHEAIAQRHPALLQSTRWVSVRGPRAGARRVESADPSQDLLDWLGEIVSHPPNHFSMKPLR